MRNHTRVLISTFLLLCAVVAFGQNTNVLPNGGFESGKPSLWNAEAGASGATLTWASDQVYGGTRSLKIVKPATGSMARWMSKNMVRYWVDNIPKNVDIKLGAYVKTSGVNTAPANDAARWQLKFWFYDTLGALIGGQPFPLNFDQTIATRDWYADTNGVGTVNLPVNAYRMMVSVEGGANATGTVWADNFIHVGRASAWAGQNWNGFADADSGWQYWIAPDGGNDGRSYFPGSGVTTEQARTGTSSLKIAAPVGRPSGELIYFTETVQVPANSSGKQYVLSAWVKTGSIKKDSVFNSSYALGFTWTWHTKLFADAGGWNEVGSGDYRFVLKDTSSDWTQYQVIITVPDNAVRAVSVRPRAYPLWTGVAYYDDFELSPLNATNIVQNVAGFEKGKPSLWNAEPGTSGATLTWASDQVYGGTRSLKIVKPSTGSMARWMSTNMVRYWVDNIPKNVDIKLGAYVKTSGVNTAPANDAARWQLKFWFYDTLGALIGGQPFPLNFDQTIATRDWYADTNGVGTVNLPVNAFRMMVSVEGGANATGTVWADNFIHVGRASAWAGQNWNGFADADSGWQYWIAPDGGNDGRSYFPGSGVTTEQARTGTSSLKIAAPVGRPSGELIYFNETVAVPANSSGKKYVLSAWVRTGSIKKDSVFNSSYALGFTWTWHTKLFADAGGWNEVGSGDYRFVLKDTSSGWTQYQVIITVPDNAVRAVSVRPRAYPLWTGVAYYDDFSVNGVDFVTSVGDDPRPISSTIPSDFKLEQNYPNPFNPSTTINYDLKSTSQVRLDIYNIVGQKVRTLVNDLQSAGQWSVVWNGKSEFGTQVASGIYFYRLETPNVVLTRKMVLMK